MGPSKTAEKLRRLMKKDSVITVMLIISVSSSQTFKRENDIE